MSERKGFRVFIERHDALFTVVGAGIVFLAFFMKEGVRDSSRELSSSIKEADFQNQIKLELAFIGVRVEDAYERQPDPTLTAHDPDEVARDILHRADFKIRSMEINAFSNTERFDRANDLLASLSQPRASFEGVKQTALRAVMEETKARYAIAEAISRFQELESHRPQTDKLLDDKKTAEKHLNETFSAYDRPAYEEVNAVERFVRLVNGEAYRQLERQEKRVLWSTRASYALFAVGWGLGLIGKLLKLPALGGAGATE